MKIYFYILIILILTNCDNGKKQNKIFDLKSEDSIEKVHEKIRFTDQQLEMFLDSIGSLSPSLWADSISFDEDSIFKNRVQMDRVFSLADFAKLKHAIRKKKNLRIIDVYTAMNIFGEIKIRNTPTTNGRIPLIFFSFDKREYDFNEYAICLGSTEEGEYGDCILYFFKGNKIIAKHNIYHRHGLEIKNYKDSDGKTVIYYKENFGSGSGIWQYNFFFYKYYEDKLIPILNELENGNLRLWGFGRIYWLESFVINTRPLTLKMVYNQDLCDTNEMKIIDDSTFIQYTWNEKTRTLNGNYEKSKINKFQKLTYYLAYNELLFINSYYTTLKDCLNDKTKRQAVLNYLNDIKNKKDN